MVTLERKSTSLLELVRRARVTSDDMSLWYTGGAGYVVKTVDATLLIDPFLGPSNPPHWIRAIPPAFEPDEIQNIDAVLLTHEHGDHADPVALGAIAERTTARVIGPASCIEVASKAGVPSERCLTLAHDETTTIGGLHVTAVPMNDPGAKGCNGYVLETTEVTILHCGDSMYFAGFAELGKRWSFDAACVSVGSNPIGRVFYMDEADAARAARDCGARMLIPHHFDLWQGITLDPRRVATVARWYCPDVRVVPARFRKRITVAGQAAESGLA